MGFIVKQPILCDKGELNEFYVAIENYNIRKNEGSLWTTVTCYTDSTASKNNYNLPIHQSIGSYNGLIGVSINYNGGDIQYPTFFQFPITSSYIVENPIYENVIESSSISYYDFDENGDVVEKEKIQYTSHSVQIGVEQITKYKPDINVITGSVYPFAYSLVKEEFGKIFGYENIIDEI